MKKSLNKTPTQIYYYIYYRKNREKIREMHKLYRQQNSEKIKEYARTYMLRREPWLIRKMKEYQKEYNRNYSRKPCKDPKFRLNSNVRRSISEALEGKKEGRRWEMLVGYTLKDLMKHLEAQFDDKMIWENYGSYWHIDHIKPKYLFKYENIEDLEFKECWALSNLQPLEAIANKKKGKKYLEKTTNSL